RGTGSAAPARPQPKRLLLRAESATILLGRARRISAQEMFMSDLYSEAHRRFQDGKGTRNLADRLESLAHSEFDANDRAFIEAAAMFFLATVDHKGRPTVSYKGGAPGFVRITGPGELVFPVYDGNGMYLSLGNIAGSASVGMLFIDLRRRAGCGYRAGPGSWSPARC